MNRRLLLYGISLAVIAIVLKLIEYKTVVINHSLELYGGIIAIIFMVAGIWAGVKYANSKTPGMELKTATPTSAGILLSDEISGEDVEKTLEKLNISKREFEILQLMARGLSNQEIAEQTFVSIHTIKTHVSNLLFKLDAKRRTQAVIRAREMKIIP